MSGVIHNMKIADTYIVAERGIFRTAHGHRAIPRTGIEDIGCEDEKPVVVGPIAS